MHNQDIEPFNKADMQALGERLQQWHVGGDYIYQAGSFIFAGHIPTFAVLFEALRMMQDNIVTASDEDSRTHAQQTAKRLTDFIEWRVSQGMF